MKTLSLSILAIICSVTFYSCSKSSSGSTSTSVVGTWTLVSNNGTEVDAANVPPTTYPISETYTAGKIIIQINSNSTYVITNNSTSPATVKTGAYTLSGNTGIALIGSNDETVTGTYSISGSTLTVNYSDSEPGQSSSGIEVYSRQ